MRAYWISKSDTETELVLLIFITYEEQEPDNQISKKK